uniref:Transmembrane protein n=1 Tax=Medicago truncatula TaxID=3880 RepID=I3T4Z8_MEDTR|nr:unknown [Medicago truncatula]
MLLDVPSLLWVVHFMVMLDTCFPNSHQFQELLGPLGVRWSRFHL